MENAPGEDTSEHAMVLAHNARSGLLQVLGGLSALFGTAIDLLEWMPHGHRTLQIVTVLGVALAGLAHLSSTIATVKYGEGRVKIKTAQEAPQ